MTVQTLDHAALRAELDSIASSPFVSPADGITLQRPAIVWDDSAGWIDTATGAVVPDDVEVAGLTFGVAVSPEFATAVRDLASTEEQAASAAAIFAKVADASQSAPKPEDAALIASAMTIARDAVFTAVDTPTITVPRDSKGAPRIAVSLYSDKGARAGQYKLSDSELRSYHRASSYGKPLDSTYNLEKWSLRKAITGLASRPDLVVSVVAHSDDDKMLDELANKAKEAAKSDSAAITGTALHLITERQDRGETVEHVPTMFAPDLAAYRQELAKQEAEIVDIECFVVLDEFKVAGTFDRIIKIGDKYYVADIKTKAKEMKYGLGGFAIQQAVYAHGERYDPTTGQRSPLLPDATVDQDRAIIIHLPQGTGRCEWHWIDIAKGYKAFRHVEWTRAWQRDSNTYEAFMSRMGTGTAVPVQTADTSATSESVKP